jgi:RecA-family ATPase
MSALEQRERELQAAFQTAAKIDAGHDEKSRVILVRASTITPEPIAWLWGGWLALGKLHILAGKPGTGKTTLSTAMAAAITRGGNWPDGSRAAAGKVAIWSGEDDPADTITPRLLAAGADLERVVFVNGLEKGRHRLPFDPATDMALLSDALADERDVRLLILDPISTSTRGDGNNNTEVRRGLQPVVDLLAARRCAGLGISHLTKGTDRRDPLERVIGSQAFGAVARVVMLASKQAGAGDETRPRLLCRAKSNIGPDGGGFEYELRQRELNDHPGVVASYVEWGASVEGEARELMAAAEAVFDADTETASDEQRDAKSFLRRLLADGPMPAKEVFAEAKEAGYSESQMGRAGSVLNIKKKHTAMQGPWMWSMPTGSRGEGDEDGEDNGLPAAVSTASPSSPSWLPEGLRSCGDCQRFDPDIQNPAGGLGGCDKTPRRFMPSHAACRHFELPR